MNNLNQFWKLRSDRERRLIVISMALILLFFVISASHWIVSKTTNSKSKLVSAKSDYEHVYEGALLILGQTSEDLLKNNPNEVFDSIRSLSSEQSILLMDIRLNDEGMVIDLGIESLDQIIKFIESMHSSFALNLVELSLISSNEQKTVTLIYSSN
ncbi:type II secretion system protein M [Gammaproteobacteria bacterium]|nr:type II secretion system protein M [Gammaproteobacteria bacterium]